MKFAPGDKIIYSLSKREYIVIVSYRIKHDGQTLELMDIKPIKPKKFDVVKILRGVSVTHFELVKKKK